jgi:hypothetical protein
MPEMVLGLFLLCAMGVILGTLYLRHRNAELLHQERMAALEKGVAVPSSPMPAWSPRVYLLRGLIWSFIGVALMVSFYSIFLATNARRHMSAESQAYSARNLAHDLAIPLDQAQAIVQRDAAARTDQGPPAETALLGLIPLAVGIAYLVFYYSDPSRKTGAGPS